MNKHPIDIKIQIIEYVASFQRSAPSKRVLKARQIELQQFYSFLGISLQFPSKAVGR